MVSAMIVVGIDPGTASTGYGVVEGAGSRLRALAAGVIETHARTPLERRLADIHARVGDLLDEHQPSALAIEELYFGANARTAFAVGQARGVVLLVAGRRADHVVIECGGVGYRLAVSSETLRHVPAVANNVLLHCHLVVRDDALQLYGFATEEERELFLMLIAVQSVGPKVALAVLSGGPPRELLKAVAAGDSARLQAAPGVGKRTAERIIVELREKVGAATAAAPV